MLVRSSGSIKMAACLTFTLWKQCKIVNDIIEVNDRFKSYNATILQKSSTHFPLFSHIKRCEIESSTRSESLECLVSNEAGDCSKQEPPKTVKTFKFNVSGTPKFPGA